MEEYNYTPEPYYFEQALPASDYNYDTSAAFDGYLDTGYTAFADYGSDVVGMGGSDVFNPYPPDAPAPSVPTADVLRDSSNPIYAAPAVIAESGQSADGGFQWDFDGLFRSVIKPALAIGGAVLAGELAGKPSAAKQLQQVQSKPVVNPFVLPSFLGGGTMPRGTSTTMWLVLGIGLAGLLLFRMMRK
jgi:hypothetical protein